MTRLNWCLNLEQQNSKTAFVWIKVMMVKVKILLALSFDEIHPPYEVSVS